MIIITIFMKDDNRSFETKIKNKNWARLFGNEQDSRWVLFSTTVIFDNIDGDMLLKLELFVRQTRQYLVSTIRHKSILIKL